MGIFVIFLFALGVEIGLVLSAVNSHQSATRTGSAAASVTTTILWLVAGVWFLVVAFLAWVTCLWVTTW